VNDLRTWGERVLVWAKGLLAAAIGGSVNSIGVMIADPTTFNLHDGLGKVQTVAVTGAILAVGMYLKQSPLPGTEK
jgi:hypothetical protein